MSDAVEIKIDSSELTALLKRLQAKVQDMSPIMREAAGIMHDAVEQNFAEEGRPWKWPALKDSTIQNRRKRGHWPGKILQVSGQLAASITPESDATHAIVGTNLVYATTQQFGASKGQFGTKTVQVRGHKRKGAPTGKLKVIGGSSRSGGQILDVVRKKKQTVKAHTRKMVIPWGNIPPRPFLYLSTSGEIKLKQAFVRYLGGV